MRANLKLLLIFAVAIAIAFPPKADAYLDPGTGSYVLQILAAFFLGGIFVIKTFWQQIKAFFSKFSGKDKKKSEKSKTHDK